MPVIRNPQFYFKEGFCWSLINGTRSENDLKFRISPKGVNDVGGMSLSSLHNIIPEFFIVCLGNSNFISRYTEAFVNFTVNFQVNDARLIPVVVPSKNEVANFNLIYNSAIDLKKEQSKRENSNKDFNLELDEIQSKLSSAIDELYSI